MGAPIPHGAVRFERQQDGTVIAYFWNEHLQQWTFEDPTDGLGGCQAVFWIGLVTIVTVGLWFYAAVSPF